MVPWDNLGMEEKESFSEKELYAKINWDAHFLCNEMEESISYWTFNSFFYFTHSLYSTHHLMALENLLVQKWKSPSA